MRRTSSGSAAPSRRSTSQLGTAAPLSSAIRRTCPAFVTGMIPGTTACRPERGELVDEAEVVLGLEEELGDREVGVRQLGRQQPAVRRPIGRPRCTSGWAATPIEKSSAAMSAISSEA
jgi:hypothetical protein